VIDMQRIKTEPCPNAEALVSKGALSVPGVKGKGWELGLRKRMKRI
jgi:hypothetical protein